MRKFELEITFTTDRSISQETAMEMWKLGTHFQSRPGSGGRTYRLVTAGTSKSIPEAVAAVCESIALLVVADGHNDCTITDVRAQVRP